MGLGCGARDVLQGCEQSFSLLTQSPWGLFILQAQEPSLSVAPEDRGLVWQDSVTFSELAGPAS